MASSMGNNARLWLYRSCSFVLMLTLLSADLFVFLERGLFTAPEAQAAVGDFSVFREATGGEVFTTTPLGVTWDTIVEENPTIALDGNNSNITLSDGGRYFVTYNVWTEEGAAGGADRRSVATYLTLDGVTQENGWGGGYIRDAENDTSAYNTGAAIISAAPGQDLRVVVARDDANAAAGTAIRPATNGVSVIRLSDELDFLRIHTSNRSADISGNTTFTDVAFDTADEVDTGSFDFTPASADVTLKGGVDQLFLVTANVKLNVDTGTAPRQNYELRLTLDGTEIDGTRSNTYLRGTSNGHNVINGTMQYVGLVKKTSASDQTFNVEVRRESAFSGPTDIVADQTALSMVALPETVKAISLTHNANQLLTSARTVVNWNQQLLTTPASFTHVTGAGNDNIEIAADGDYLFFASTYTSRTSGGGRDVPRLEWQIDTAVQNYGGHGSFNRGTQGGQDALTSGSSGAVLFPAMTSGQVVELVQSDESNGAPASNFIANRVALQALDIVSLIPLGTTEMSVIGDQTATVAPNRTDLESGEQFVIAESDSARNVTSITLSEDGTIAADTGLANVRLVYDLDTTAPYNCASESYGGSESQFGSTGTFSGADGIISFTGSETISPTQTMCVYVVFDTTASASDGETINTFIASPNNDVIVTAGGTVTPFGSVGTSLSTVVAADITQANFHWRNDDGSQTGATSATGGIENTPGLAFAADTPQRLRLGINAEGSGSQSTAFRLEYGENVSTCSDVSTWVDVGASGGAWDMADSVNVFEGANTTNIPITDGGVSDGTGTFLTPNGGVRDASSQTGTITIPGGDFVELEYSIQATLAATQGVAHCFRVVNAASAATFLAGYDQRVPFTVPASAVDATLTDFPVYVDLADLGAEFWAGVQSDGDDIRVTTGNAVSEVPFELVSINTGTQTGELHFRASTLSASANNEFFIYFGNGSATPYAVTDPFGRNNVWSNGFIAVYHLAEDGSTTALIDSTGNNNDGSGNSLDPADRVAGKLPSSATNFDGNPEAITVTDSADFDWSTGAISGWLQTDTLTSDGTLASRGGGGTSEMLLWFDEGVDDLVCAASINNQFFNGSSGGTYTTRTTGEWLHGFCSWDGSSLVNYVNGTSNYTNTSPSGSLDNDAVPATIGRDNDGRFLDGRLDEVRYHNTGRSAAWVAAEYANQDAPGSFYTIGAAETPQSALGTVGYNVYPEATLSADVTVRSTGTQITTVDSGSLDTMIGGAFVITSNSGARTVTGITVTETGSIDAQQFLLNPRIAIEFDTTAPYNCVSESYNGSETELTGSNFLDPNGTTTVTATASINLTRALCAYVIVDVSDDTPDGAEIDFEISIPNIDVTAGAASVGPGTAIVLDGTTTVLAPALNQANYHWRNDDGSETSATSASGGAENTPIGGIFQDTQQRLRFAVANEGSATASGVDLRLEYGTKVTSCENVGSWERVNTGVAFDMDTTSQLVDGANTTNISVANGGVSNPNPTFLTANNGQVESADELAVASLSNTQFIEVEYALTLTDASAFRATYCFRLTNGGVPFATYGNYAELTVQDRQDFVVQRGTQVVSGTGVTLTAGVDYTAPSSNTAAYVRITDTNSTGAGSITAGSTIQPDDMFAYIEGGDNLTSSFSIVRPPTATGNTRVQWEIIEYIGIAGADNEFILRDAGEVTYGGSALTASGPAVTGVVDDNDVVVFITGQYNPATNVGDYNTALSISSWNAVTDQPSFERGDADGIAARVSYAVVEFTGASWAVQRAEHTFSAAGVTETQPITAVNSLLRTFVHPQKLSGDELINLDESGHEVWLSSIGAVSFQLENNSTNPSQQRSVAWVIENTQLGDGSMAVYRSNGLIAQTNTQPTTYLFNIGATVVPQNASIWATTRSTGGGNAHPRAQLGARVLNSTQFELWKSDEGQNQNFRVEVVEWPVAEPSIRQTHYRLYVDNDALTPTDPWPAGPSDLGENAAMTDTDEPLGDGEQTRIRLGLFINNASLVADSLSFKLQYARRVSTCSAVSTWDDVGEAGGSATWRAVDGAPADGTELLGGGALLLSTSNIAGTYEENSPSAPNPNNVEVGEYLEYDWLVQNNAAIQKSSYCFRMTQTDGSVLSGYDVYPTVRTSGYTPVIANWRWYTDTENLTPTSPLAGENVAPSAVSNGEELKLRVSVTEVEGAPGQNIKFNLQYSEYPDFRDAVVLSATTSCDGNDLWCYVDGAGADNQTIETTVLTGVDSCAAGVGVGCGTYNEAVGLSGVYNQPAFSTSEHEFTLRHDGARVNAVYYFRLFDATNGVPLFASGSFPSLTTEGAVLTFAVRGIATDTTTEGVTTDITTQATEVNFGSLAMDTDQEAAQRLTIFTNGTQGYQVFMVIDQDLSDSYGNTIASVAGTNAAPTAWSTGCTSATTGCFGYHVGDDSLGGGSLRFALDDTFAGVESGPVEVMASNVPVTFDVSEIIYRTRVSFLQPAGDYTATIQYIAVPVF